MSTNHNTTEADEHNAVTMTTSVAPGDDSDSDACVTASGSDTDTEGSLVDFIVHDSSGEETSSDAYTTNDEDASSSEDDDESSCQGRGNRRRSLVSSKRDQNEPRVFKRGRVIITDSDSEDAKDENENENEKKDDDEADDDEADGDVEDDDTEDDGDAFVRRQYSEACESNGLVVLESGVRRSMRAAKGQAPIRYVDEDYLALMREDVDLDALCSESQEEEGEEL